MRIRKAAGLVLLTLTLSAALGCAAEDKHPAPGYVDDSVDDNPLDTGSASVSSPEQIDTDTGYATSSDADSDGYGPSKGDCDDQEPAMGPDALEDLGSDGSGDGLDNDCDAETDETEAAYCDCPGGEATAEGLANALELCDERFLFAALKRKTSAYGDLGIAVSPALGANDCLMARQGCGMAILSTGPVGQPNPNDAISMGGIEALTLDPQPLYQGSKKTSPLAKQRSCDVSQLRLELVAPNNAQGFSFDVLFASAEYDEFINVGYNDTFYAILEHPEVNGGKTTNIAFDDLGREIQVNSNYFENKAHPCDETGSGWEPEIDSKAGSTGWLRTSWPVSAGKAFTLTFSIHDEGDCIYDSIAFLDNFHWSTVAVKEGTVPL